MELARIVTGDGSIFKPLNFIVMLIRIEFNGSNDPQKNPYTGRHLEIRQSGSQVRFYEVDPVKKKEYCLTRETIQYLLGRSIPRKQAVLKALKGDKLIFQTP